VKKEISETQFDEFNSAATSIYNSVYNEFCVCIKKLNRNHDENVFRMQAAKFGYALKSQLDALVKKILENSNISLREQLHANLSTRVDFYLNQFKQKWNAL